MTNSDEALDLMRCTGGVWIRFPDMDIHTRKEQRDAAIRVLSFGDRVDRAKIKLAVSDLKYCSEGFAKSDGLAYRCLLFIKPCMKLVSHRSFATPPTPPFKSWHRYGTYLTFRPLNLGFYISRSALPLLTHITRRHLPHQAHFHERRHTKLKESQGVHSVALV